MIWLALLLAQAAVSNAAPDIAAGETIFAQSCSVGYCHGAAGAAGRGPRLRGRTFTSDYLYKVIADGIPNSAMPAWKGRLKEAEIRSVLAYVMSLASATDPAPPANPMPPGVGPAALSRFSGPPEAERGHALFFDASRDMRCGVCHALGGRGIMIGPDLANSRDVAAGMHATRSQHVLAAILTDGEKFPALLAGQEANWVKLFDLSVPPPVLRTLNRADIKSMTPDSGWSHQALLSGYTPAQLNDIAAYIRWAVTGLK